MQRQRQLERCGLEFFRIRESVFRASKEHALDRLWDMLEERGIHPATRSVDSTSRSGADEEQHDTLTANCAQDHDELGDGDDTLPVASDAESAEANRKAEGISAGEIEAAVIQALSKCANHTCTMKSITARVLRECRVLTRGKPREVFERRTMRCVAKLEEDGRIRTYKSKNWRLRLVQRDLLGNAARVK
jgi:hypothetical protein